MKLNPKECTYEESVRISVDPEELVIWFKVPKETLYQFFRTPEEGGEDYGNVVGGCLALTLDGTMRILDPKQSYRLSLSPVVRDEDGGEHDEDAMVLTEGTDFTRDTISGLLDVYIKQRIEGLKSMQEFGKVTRCPRCGGRMAGTASRHAISRNADVYVCDECGTREALYAWQHQDAPESLRNWVYTKECL